ncbi:MAG: 3-phosphoshikimate 1-carboxyvinyltransferase [Chloroflexota bacterium]|nr:3-phosphoshikimate 1-carboxyvinyltransferase [Chloroflexota bacterium]
MTTVESGKRVARIRRASRLRGRVRLPGDKSITHRALMLAGLAEGEMRVLAGSDGLDCNSTARCLEMLGVTVERVGPAKGGRVDRVVRSGGPRNWRGPAGTLDCGNSGTTLRLLAGILAGLPLRAVLDGDASLRRRPVARIIEPLRSMGATLHARDRDSVPPLTVIGRNPLRPIDYTTPVPSAQVKSAILLAALSADGETTVREHLLTRDHTERMMRARGVTVTTGGGSAETPSWVSVQGGRPVQPIDERVPGDLSAAAFWLVAGAAHPDAELVVERVGMNPTRRAVIDLLRRMGARIEQSPLDNEGTEPAADVAVRTSDLEGIEIGPGETAGAIDEIPVLCLAAACAKGSTLVRGAGELRHKESDRIEGLALGLTALGARVEVSGNDITVHGRSGRAGYGLRGAEVVTAGDHRLAMTFAVAGLLAAGETLVGDADSVAVSDPAFFSNLEAVQA